MTKTQLESTKSFTSENRQTFLDLFISGAVVLFWFFFGGHVVKYYIIGTRPREIIEESKIILHSHSKEVVKLLATIYQR